MARLLRFLVVLLMPSRIPDIIKFCNAVILAMTNNKWFPAPSPTIAVLTAAVNALEQAETLAAGKAKGTAPARDAELEIVLSLMNQERGYVQTVIDANAASGLAAAIAESAFMSLRKKRVTKPSEFTATQGSVSGTVDLEAPGAGRGGTHYWGFGTDGKTFASAPETTKRKTSIANLTPGTLYYFRHKTLTPKGGMSDWGQTITLMMK
jgi:hypothetical protein